MRVTVCQMRDDEAGFAADWGALVAYVRDERSELVLLPELPFAPWFATEQAFQAPLWREVLAAHARWDERLGELAPAIAIATRPVERGGARLNEAFAATPDGARLALHEKRYLPDEAGFWEASWYARGDGRFALASLAGAHVGMQVCTELWMFECARQYGLDGADIIAAPRATPASSTERWIVAGRAAAMSAGAFCISSNHAGESRGGFRFGGTGWIIDPDGAVLATTSDEAPFATRDIDLARAAAAKHTYPRYVR